MKLSPAPFASLVILMIGCGGDKTEMPRALCDPMAPAGGLISLEARTTAERLTRGLTVLYDNGAYYLFVDEQCNYRVNDPLQVWSETRSGVLDSATAAKLGADLHFGEWPDLQGLWSNPINGTFDAPILVFDDAEEAVVCADFCDAPDVPEDVKAMRDELPTITQDLWDHGVSAPSSVRAVAVPTDSGPGIPFVGWPLARPISDFVRTDGAAFGQGILEDDAPSVQALKELRTSFVQGDHGAFVWDMLPVVSGGAYYQLYVRDTLPFEDAQGIVPLTVEF